MTECAIRESANPRRVAAIGRWLLAACCGLVLAGCAGGSGSSGFDIVAAENAAIDAALAGARCVVERGLTICASGAVEAPVSPTPTAPPPTGAPQGTPTRTATPVPAQPGIDVALDPADVAACAAVDVADPCTVRLVFLPMAAPGDAAYRAAVRQRDPDGPWRVMPVNDSQVVIAVGPDVVTLQTAILLFEGDPGPVPSEVAVLSESGADFAFVTPPFAVRDAAGP